MIRTLAGRFFLASSLLILPAPLWAANITINTVLVGNPGNANDTHYFGGTPIGAVATSYRMGTYEVTNAEYAAFLNAKAKDDVVFLYNASMSSTVIGGIDRTGSPGSYVYTVKTSMGNKPVNYVDWYSSVRFTNWLHNGQGNGSTETGAYNLGALGAGGIPTNPNGITRDAGARWFIPSQDEWYKAAYYDPRTTAQGGPPSDSHYWLYPTTSNTAPTIAAANSAGDISNPGLNVFNSFTFGSNGNWNGMNHNVTTVGSAGPLSDSFYGTYDQGGNVWEWSERRTGGQRNIRGGSSQSGSAHASQDGDFQLADSLWPDVGFRVATSILDVPEPSSLALAALGLAALWALPRRVRR